MSRCLTIDSELLKKTKIDKLLLRVSKKGDERGKRLTQKIMDNSIVADKKSGATGTINGATRKPSQDLKVSSGDEIRSVTQSPAKKPSVEPASKTAGALGSTKVKSASSDSKVSLKTKAESVGETKTKVVNVTAKPSGFFSSLKSASKKPGTSSKTDDGASGYPKSLKLMIHC